MLRQEQVAYSSRGEPDYKSLEVYSDCIVQARAANNELKVLGYTFPITASDQTEFVLEQVATDGTPVLISVVYSDNYTALEIYRKNICNGSNCYNNVAYTGNRGISATQFFKGEEQYNFSVIHLESETRQGQQVDLIDTTYRKDIVVGKTVGIPTLEPMGLTSIQLQLNDHQIALKEFVSYISYEEADFSSSKRTMLYWEADSMSIAELHRTYDDPNNAGVSTGYSVWSYRGNR